MIRFFILAIIMINKSFSSEKEIFLPKDIISHHLLSYLTLDEATALKNYSPTVSQIVDEAIDTQRTQAHLFQLDGKLDQHFQKLADFPLLRQTASDPDLWLARTCFNEILKLIIEQHKKDTKKTQLLIEDLASQGHDDGIAWKSYGLETGSYGYKKDLKASQTYLNSLHKMKAPQGARMIYNALKFGSDTFKRSTTDLMIHIEHEIKAGNPEAIDWMISEGTQLKNYTSFIEEHAKNGHVQAKKTYIDSLFYGLYGFPKNPNLAIEKLNQAYQKNIPSLVDYYLALLGHGNQHIKAQPQKALQLNENLLKKGDERALVRKVRGLLNGENGYLKSSERAKDFINEKALEGNGKAIDLKLLGLEFGFHGYAMDHGTLKQSLNLYAQRKHPLALFMIFKGHLRGHYGFTKDHSLALDYLRALGTMFPRLSAYMTVMELRFGLNGREKDLTLARELVLLYGVPF